MLAINHQSISEQFCDCIRGRARRTRVAISQRHGFSENRLADERAQAAANDHLDAPPQELFEVGDQTPGKPRRRLAGYVDKNVQVAFESFFAPSDRAENADIGCTVSGSDAQDLVSMIFYLRGYAHLSILYCILGSAENDAARSTKGS